MKRALIFLFILATIIFWRFKPNSNYITVGGARLRIETAEIEAKRTQGLSDRKTLCSNCGLLFIFDKTGGYGIWMRRMHFDIDILWLADNKVVDITYAAKKPSKEEFDFPKTIYHSKLPVDKILEVNAGWVEKNKIKIGDIISHYRPGREEVGDSERWLKRLPFFTFLLSNLFSRSSLFVFL